MLGRKILKLLILNEIYSISQDEDLFDTVFRWPKSAKNGLFERFIQNPCPLTAFTRRTLQAKIIAATCISAKFFFADPNFLIVTLWSVGVCPQQDSPSGVLGLASEPLPPEAVASRMAEVDESLSSSTET